MWHAWLAVALANPPPAYEIEVVSDELVEGQVRIELPGREGDMLRIDGMVFGHLPITTELVEGLHHFRVDGERGRFEITTQLVAKKDELVVLDLARAKPPAPTDKLEEVEAPKAPTDAPASASADD